MLKSFCSPENQNKHGFAERSDDVYTLSFYTSNGRKNLDEDDFKFAPILLSCDSPDPSSLRSYRMTVYRRLQYHLTAIFLLLPVLLLLSCQQSPFLPVQLDNSGAQRVLSFYFGSYETQEGQSLTEAGILQIEEENVLLDIDRLNLLGLSQALEDINNNGIIEWEELEPFLAATYYEARGFPPTIDALFETTSRPTAENGWLHVELDGMMVSAKRQIFVKESAIQNALLAYQKNNNQILYPIGTTFIGNHYTEEQLIETTVSQKRDDQFWDFFIYDQAGNLTPTTATGPKTLIAPTRCVGCHFGSKLFEPDVSFPAEASDGPFGPRGIYVGDEARNTEIAAILDEHAKRSDTVLGVYGTIYTSQLNARRALDEPLTEEELKILETLLNLQ